MTVQNNITVFTGDTRNNAQTGKADHTNTNAGDGRNKTIYAGNLLTEFPLRDRIQQRRAQAQERAMKLVSDAWDGEKKIDSEMKRSRDHIEELNADKKEAQENINQLIGKQKELMEAYGVEEGSREQQDLELLGKAQAAMRPGSGVELTEEEKERLAGISGNELTDFQRRWLDLNSNIQIYRDEQKAANQKLETENAVIRGIRGEKRKSHKMVDAQEQAEDVMEASRDEIIGMVVDAAKDHIDEEQEKREEEAEAIKEKKEEQEEILEEHREKEEEQEELMEDMPVDEAINLESTQLEIRKEIQDIVNRMNLVVEDIKGASVDEML